MKAYLITRGERADDAEEIAIRTFLELWRQAGCFDPQETTVAGLLVRVMSECRRN